MPQIHEIGRRAYVQYLRLRPGAPIVETAPTYETDEPHRVGQTLIIRLWPTTHAVAVGRWIGRAANPADAMLGAMRSILVPRKTGPQDWCERCGATKQCTCWDDHEEDPGYCPRCTKVWDECPCLDGLAARYVGRVQ